MLEEAGEITSHSYWVRWGRPGFLALTKPGHEITKAKIPRLEPKERFALANGQGINLDPAAR